jgi:hypothetical protein
MSRLLLSLLVLLPATAVRGLAGGPPQPGPVRIEG